MLGFVGLGYMGSRMAMRLLSSGHALGVYNRTPERTRPFADRGARVYDSVSELAREVDVVLTMLPEDSAVEQVVLGPAGVVSGARAGTTLIDLSSVHPDTSRRIASAAAHSDVAVLDAAVSGSTPQQKKARSSCSSAAVGQPSSVVDRSSRCCLTTCSTSAPTAPARP